MMELGDLKPCERFSRVARDYALYRPGYPLEMIETLVLEYGLARTSVIADIGSGTGLFSRLFVDFGNTVYAVEPNEDMRAAAEALFAGKRGFVSVNGVAEYTELPDRIADYVVAGQAFHWFKKEDTRIEFKRIAKENGRVVLAWNTRDNTKPFMQRYDDLVQTFCPDIKKIDRIVYSEQERNAEIERFFSPHQVARHIFGYSQVFDFEELSGRLRSSSYSPTESSYAYKALMGKLRELFDEYEDCGTILFEYLTEMFVAKIA